MTIQNKPVVEILRELFLKGLNLPQEYNTSKDGKIIPSVFVRDRKINYGHTPELQIELQSIGSKVFFNRSTINEEGNEERDIQSRELIQIVMTSEDRSAEERKHELISLLSSQLSFQLQEQWNIKIAPIPDSVHTMTIPTGPYSILKTIITLGVISCKTYTNPTETFDTINYNPNVDEVDESDIITIDLTKRGNKWQNNN